MKPHLKLDRGEWLVRLPGSALVSWPRFDDACAYARLLWQTYLASLSVVERGWPSAVH